MEIKIREATKGDSRLIAEVIAMAIGFDLAEDYAGSKDVIKVMSEAAEREDSQYSYRNALIAEAGGRPVGAIVGYDGAKLKELRDGSLAVIRKYHPDVEIKEDETEQGEFYLDSLGVLPEYRGKGIATTLINSMIDKASAQGHKRFGLLVDPENPNAERLYKSLGFKYVGERPFFGHMMKHLVATK